MWYVFLFVVALLLVGALTPKPNVENARAAKLGDFQFPRSNHGDPMPIIWGTVRQKGPITAWYGDYKPVAITQKVKSGLFSSKRVVTGYKNYIGIDCVLALGPNVTLRRLWAGTYMIWSGNLSAGDITINLPELFGGEKEGGGLKGTATFYNGGFDPVQDPYLKQVIGPNVPAYNGLARMVFKKFYIGTSTTPKAFSFEVSRLTNGLHPVYSLMPNGYDVNPMEICFDALTQKWGRFGNLPSDLNVDSFIDCAKTLYDEQIGMSLLLQSVISGKDLLEEVMRVADGLLYQDPATSQVVAKLIRQDYDVSSLLVLDESSISTLKNFKKTTWENTFNQCRVTFKNRATDYDESVAVTQDFANINFQNRVKSTDLSVPGCTDATVASKLAARQLSFLNVPLYKCDFVANRKAQNLRPGSVFVLNWAPFNITNMVMRVTSIDFGELTNNQIQISAVQDRFGSQDVVFANPESSGWVPANTDPNEIVLKNIFNPPAFLAFAEPGETPSTFDSAGRLYVLAVPPSNASVSYDILLSTNNFANEPTLAVDDANYNGGGYLVDNYAASIAATTRHDTSGVFKVGGLSSGAISSLVQYGSLESARDGSALLMVDNELFVYIGFIENSDGTVTFPNLYRSVLDTAPGLHASNARVWFISGSDGLVPNLLPVSSAAQFKLLDQTSMARYPESSALSSSVSVTNRQALPLQPQYPTIAGSRTPTLAPGLAVVTVAWYQRSRADVGLRVFDDAQAQAEPGVETRVRWRVGSGAYTELFTTSNTTVLNVAGLVGTLEVVVDSRITANNRYSSNSESITAQLT